MRGNFKPTKNSTLIPVSQKLSLEFLDILGNHKMKTLSASPSFLFRTSFMGSWFSWKEQQGGLHSLLRRKNHAGARHVDIQIYFGETSFKQVQLLKFGD